MSRGSRHSRRRRADPRGPVSAGPILELTHYLCGRSRAIDSRAAEKKLPSSAGDDDRMSRQAGRRSPIGAVREGVTGHDEDAGDHDPAESRREDEDARRVIAHVARGGDRDRDDHLCHNTRRASGPRDTPGGDRHPAHSWSGESWLSRAVATRGARRPGRCGGPSAPRVFVVLAGHVGPPVSCGIPCQSAISARCVARTWRTPCPVTRKNLLALAATLGSWLAPR